MSDESRQPGLARLFLVNPDSILGLMIFSVVLAIQEESTPPLVLALVSMAGVFALWVAHVFAHTVAGHSITKDHRVSLVTSFRHSVADAWPMFAWTAPSVSVLLVAPLVGWTGAEAANISLYVMFGTLFVFGYLVFAYRRRRFAVRVLGGLATALVGSFVVGVELVARYIH